MRNGLERLLRYTVLTGFLMPNSAHTITEIAKELAKHPFVTYLDDVQLSDGLLAGAIKNAAVIACSDMGLLVPYVCSSAKVQLFLFQNGGHKFSSGGFVETVVGSGVEHIVVYGHSVCDYTKHMAKSVIDTPAKEGLEFSERSHLELYSVALDCDSPSLWEHVGQFNVLFELRKMLADPFILQLATERKLELHAWFYKSDSEQFEVFDPERGAFVVPDINLSNSSVISLVTGEGHYR
jgi:carbonic anhydrase